VQAGPAASATSVAFTYDPVVPSEMSISPVSGPAAGGTQATISGTGFGTTPGTVTVGGIEAMVVSWSDATVVVTVPAGAPGSAPVTVQAGLAASNNSVAFTYRPVSPSVTAISPANGPAAGGTQVTISGAGFGTVPGTVFVGGVPASVVSWSDTNAVVIAPAGTPGPAAVSVQAGAEVSATLVAFTYDMP
jgi:hypothetical protein